MNIIDKINIKPAGLIIYIPLLISGIVFASFYGGMLPFVVLYGLLLFFPVSFGYLFLNYHFLYVYQTLDVHRLVKGDRHIFKVSFENTGFLPIHDMEPVLYLDRCDFSGMDGKDRIRLEEKEKKKVSAKITCLYAGTYEIGIKGLKFSDAFGILSVTFAVPYSFRAIVSPRITDLANPYLDIENILNSTGLKSETRREEIPGNDIRPYYPGDPLASINWKVSARLDKLAVRVPDRMDTRVISLYLEASNVPEKLKDTEYIRRRDHFLEFAVSAAYYFASRGIPVNIIYPSGKITEKTIDSYEGFLEFYNDASSGINYRSDDEYDRMSKLVRERRMVDALYETRVFISEEASGSEDFCLVTG